MLKLTKITKLKTSRMLFLKRSMFFLGGGSFIKKL